MLHASESQHHQKVAGLRGTWLLSVLVLGVAALAFAPAQISPDTYLSEVKYLASPELKGRATGSPELEKAAAYISGLFKSFGLKPVSGSDYLQPFTVTVNAHLGPANSFSTEDAGASAKLTSGRDYTPLSFSSSAKVSGEVVFAGYGITANDLHYDDYAGLDVKDKIVLILRHEPQENDEKSIFDGTQLTSHATFADKASNAKMHGARGVILVNDTPAHPKESDNLLDFGNRHRPDRCRSGLRAGEGELRGAWFKAEGRDLHQIEADIDKDLKPQSFALAKLTVNHLGRRSARMKTVHNVEAYLPGDHFGVRRHRRALRPPRPGRRAFAGALADRHDPSRRRR